MSYIKIDRVYEKLKKAEEFYTPVIITAGSGWGKSAAVKYYYRRKKHHVLRCGIDGCFHDMPTVASMRSNVVLIEDMQWLSDLESINYLRMLLSASGRQIVMMTRGAVPGYLLFDGMARDFIRIQEADLAMGEDEVSTFFSNRGISISRDIALKISRTSKGYFPAVYYAAVHMANGDPFDKKLAEYVKYEVFRMWDGYLFDQLQDDFTEFALYMCPYDSFTLDMAGYMTGNSNAAHIIEYCRDKTNQIEYLSDGLYRLRSEMREYYLWKRRLVWSESEILESDKKASLYYRNCDDIENALRCSLRAKDGQRVVDILKDNCFNRSFGGLCYVLREYCEGISGEDIRKNPRLMAGLCIIYCNLMDYKNAIAWEKELMVYALDDRNEPSDRSEADRLLNYLKLSLPICEGDDVYGIVFDAVSSLMGETGRIPGYVVTGNLPSLLNGSRDYYIHTKDKDAVLVFLKEAYKEIRGSNWRDYVNLVVTEDGFEKALLSDKEVIERCLKGFETARFMDSFELCFAAVGIQMRQYLISGKYSLALRKYEELKKAAKSEELLDIKCNIKAFGMWLSLYGGITEEASAYADCVEDAQQRFYILAGYRQLVKLRCLIGLNRLDEAMELTLLLEGYLKHAKRHYDSLVNTVLKAVILYRLGDKRWVKELKAALQTAGETGLVRAVSMEGAGIYPVLMEYKDRVNIGKGKRDFFEKIYIESGRMAVLYPEYLKFEKRERVSFTKRESQVMALLCAGFSNAEICEKMGITYDGIKKHNRNIYRKLGVNNRAQAERAAERLGFVHRKN